MVLQHDNGNPAILREGFGLGAEIGALYQLAQPMMLERIQGVFMPGLVGPYDVVYGVAYRVDAITPSLTLTKLAETPARAIVGTFLATLDLPFAAPVPVEGTILLAIRADATSNFFPYCDDQQDIPANVDFFRFSGWDTWHEHYDVYDGTVGYIMIRGYGY